ncbi:MAG: OmpA family protein [Elusimicrobia bacterium]|nr:OmpA family protein [Elusimicrobiota bacterium]MBD3412353.1 OmpA family protein [Elusimicrobiota bacterium]
MVKRRAKQESKGGNWLLTYGCLMTQLLVFFVMLFALAAATTEDQLKKIQRRVREYVAENNYQDLIHDVIDTKGLVISISSELMFESGKAELASEKSRNIITDLFTIFQEYPNRVVIEGHTDNRPISTPVFPSNWELSTARATSLTRYLIEELKYDPERLTSSGYGEYQPIASNETPQGRAKNRRVDVIVRRLTMQQYKEINKKMKEEAKKVISLTQ